MKLSNVELTSKLQELVNLQTEIKLQEDKYASLSEADESSEILKEIRHKIKYLKVELKAKEEHAMTLFS